ncbi:MULTISPECIES: transcriptional regulator GcvA [Agrobacterium tumefaciens complex]|uniref:transcriptional regulator GcvA n=1 Tax=Agrobacterium tumefaciens TaxID=358 RepID=UPI000FE29540|nr:transcriptional regulator GcvA [Agrobacterium tumefaciens]QAB01049.1 transcriptional regulator [Agrobacterium tumefaciens]
MPSRLPSLNGLRTFEAAARYLSFTKAAAELNVTQTAVSHQIQRLEQELGVKLFLRHGHELALTPEAKDYLPGVRSAFRDLRQASEQLQRKGQNSVLTISTLASLTSKWLLPRLPAFQAQHPDIDVRISASMDLVTFRDDGIDAAIRYGLGKWPNLQVDWLMADDLFPVCSPALLERQELRTPHDLARHTLLQTSGVTSDDWRLWLTAAGLPATYAASARLTFDLNLVTVQAAVDGLGVAIGRTAYVEGDIRAGRLIVPFDVALPSEAGFYLVTPLQTANVPRIAAFREWLLSTLQQKQDDIGSRH